MRKNRAGFYRSIIATAGQHVDPEEGANSVAIPMVAVCNNLVLYDQHKTQNSLDDIARLYQERCNIELLSKWLKQTSRSAAFAGVAKTPSASRSMSRSLPLCCCTSCITPPPAASATAPRCSSPTSSSAGLAASASVRPNPRRPNHRHCCHHTTAILRLPMNLHRSQNPGQQWAKAGTQKLQSLAMGSRFRGGDEIRIARNLITASQAATYPSVQRARPAPRQRLPRATSAFTGIAA
jgi:hypothetical protein